MSRLLDVLNAYLKAKGMTREEFINQLVANDCGDEVTVRAVMNGEADACVGIVLAAQEILGLTNNEADKLEIAGREDARARIPKRLDSLSLSSR